MNLRSIKTALSHLGLKYTCPMCNYHLSSLMMTNYENYDLCNVHIIGNGRRPSICWHCFSTDRERLIYLYCKKELGLFRHFLFRRVRNPKPKLLHIAPERNLSKLFLREKHIEYVAGDYFQEGYSYPDYVQHMDITNLQIADNTFDIIICCHVLEHVIDDLKGIKELYRVLKPNGTAILQVPLCPENKETIEDVNATKEEKIRRFGQRDHVRLYGLDYKQRLEKGGFEVEVIPPNPKYAKYGVNMEESLYIARKISH